ncbi:hypothetical protein GYMLUDRAFT_33263 [Collybiopsis luxurians FD-317 M1]|nr:hypothetical protein GYMLUDRAFT_33263 [Collybiopsis luxurians FD-317 M1]
MDAAPSSSAPMSSSARSKSTSRLVSLLINASHLMKKDYAIGIALLLVVVFLWTASNFITQDLFQDGYEKAFLVTYLNTSAFALYLLPSLVRFCLRKSSLAQKFSKATRYEYQPLRSEEIHTDTSPSVESTTYIVETLGSSELAPLSTRETANLALVFCFIWFAANWTLNAALDYTSVASATILSSTSGFFTLGIGRLFNVETLSVAKIGAVIASFIGVLLVALSDSSESSSGTNGLISAPISVSTRYALGDFLALFSAAFYAFYVILLKVRIRSESRIDMQLFFGFVGLFNIILCWPIGVLLHLTGVEEFELPSTGKAVGALLVNMAITWSSDFLYVLAMLKTTPLVVTIGLSLTIPLAVVGDFFLGKQTQLQVLAGALLVLISFVVVGADDSKADSREDLREGTLAHSDG